MFCIEYFDFTFDYTLLAVVIIVIEMCICKNTDTELGMCAEV